VVVESGGRAHRFDGVDGAAAAALWEALAHPVPGSALDGLLNGAGPATRAMLDALVAAGIVHAGGAARPAAAPAPGASGGAAKPCGHLVLGVTGAVHATLVPCQVHLLLHRFADTVDVVLTRAARRFVEPRGLAVLGAGVWTDPFTGRGDVRVPHVHLAGAADLVLILPASAACCARLAHGAASDLLSLVVLATEAPVVVVPSMNSVMWRKPAVRRAVAQLRDDGLLVIEPAPGYEVGARHADPAPGAAGIPLDGTELVAALDAVFQAARAGTVPRGGR